MTNDPQRATADGPIAREDEPEVQNYLRERLQRPVGIDLWTRQESGLLRTDRDPCTHCDDVERLARQLVRLHPALSVTRYDLDKHADRAEQAGVEVAPTMILRGNSRAVHVVGLFAGLLFPPLLDVISFLSVGASPLQADTRQRLQALERDVRIEVLGTPYDPYSAYMVRVAGAFATETRRVRLHLYEMSEFPVLAGQRSLTEVPTVTIDGRRFSGAWEEPALIEQIERVLAGNDEVVVRDRVLAMPYLSEEDAQKLAQEEAAGQQGAPQDLGAAPAPGQPPQPGPSGLYIPGRD